jgi:quercetin dioxygenase-like cupin family protein
MRKPIQKSVGDISPHIMDNERHQVLLSAKNDDVSKNIILVSKSVLNSGCSFDWHKHEEFDEFFIVVSGEGIVYFQTDEEISFKTGDIINCPADIEHKVENTGQDDAVFYFFRISL